MTLEADRSFGRGRRLRTESDFRRVFEAPIRSSDRLFSIFARPQELGTARLGLAVAKKRVRRANRRNRLKRLVRESFRAHRPQLPWLDFVVVAQGAADRAPAVTLRGSLQRHWAVLSARCEPR